MPTITFRKLALWLALMAAGPVLALCLTAWLWDPPALDHSLVWVLGVFFMALAVLGAVIGAWLWQKRQARQIDFLVERCRDMALDERPPQIDVLSRLPELGRLGMAIEVMREVLVDYLSLYRRFFQAAPDMFLTLSPAGGRILDANLAFCRAVGLLQSEVIGQPVSRFVGLDEGWDTALRERVGLRTGQIDTGGGIIKVEASISLEKGAEGQSWILGAMLRDVTQREELHRELLAKSTALEKALEETKRVEELKDNFLTTLSHELKTPLVALKGFLQLLKQGRVQPEASDQYLEICWRNLTKLEHQINNLLDLARLSHAKEQYAMVPVDLTHLVRTEVDNLRPMADEAGVGLDLDNVPTKPVRILGNMDKLVQLVDNLLVNAVKYNKEGGEVRLDLATSDGKVILKVSDSGVGMAREQMAHIFNRFYRAEMSGTGRLEGLGIGLSLVQEIVLLHQGDIQVDSEPGVGTTFTVEFKSHQ